MFRHRLLAAIFILLPVLILFAPALLSERSFAMRDAAHFYYPLFHWIGAAWQQGEFPLWNPSENCGMPLLADASSSLFYPGKVLFLLPLEFATQYKLYVVGHVLLAAAGMYRLARFHSASRPAAAMAAMAYACGGNVVFQHCNVVFLVGAAWLPWSWKPLWQALQANNWAAALHLSAILALMVLGGDPQMAYHVLLCGGGGWLLLAYQAWLKRKQPAEKPALWSGLGLLILAAGGMIALSAVQFLPSSEAAKSSERATYHRPRSIYEVAHTLTNPQTEAALSQSAQGIFGEPEAGLHHSRLYNFSISPWRLVEFIWPNFGGRMYPTNRRWMSQVTAEGLIWTPSLYLGLLPLLLAVGQFSLRSSCSKTRWLSWVALWFVVGSLGHYGLGWFIREFYSTVLRGDSDRLGIGQPVGGLYWLMVTLLPTYVNFRYPAKLLVVAVAAICVLAAIGWDQVLVQPARRQRLGLWLRVIGGLSFVLLAIVWLFRQKAAEHAWLPNLTYGPFDISGSLRDVLGSLLHAGILANGLAWIVGKVSPTSEIAKKDRELLETASQNRWVWGAVGLVALDLIIANAWLIPLAKTKTWRDPSPLASEIHRQAAGRPASLSQGGLPRIYRGNLSGWHAPSFRSTTSVDRMQEATRWEHETLFPKFGLLDDLSAVFSYGSIKPIDFESFFYVADQHGPPQAKPADKEQVTTFPHPHALRLIGTEYAITPDYYQLQMGEQKPFGERQTLAPDQPSGPANCQLWKLSKPMPRTWVVSRVVLLPKLPLPTSFAAMDQRTLEVLFPLKADGEQRYARNFSREAVVESDAAESLQELMTEQGKAATGVSTVSSTSEIVYYAPNRVVLKTSLEQTGLVVLSDAYDEGWVARVVSDQVDHSEPTTQVYSRGKVVPIWRTNRILRGMHLPAGKHRIELRYEPRSYYYGARLSLISWGLVAALAVWRLSTRSNRPLDPKK